MKLVSGLDMVEIKRFTTIKPAIKTRFVARVLTGSEQLESHSDQSLAGRFAAKEAVAKALGCGIGKISWQEIEILTDSDGAPILRLYGQAAEIAAKLGINIWSVSITHTGGLAAAQVIGMG